MKSLFLITIVISVSAIFGAAASSLQQLQQNIEVSPQQQQYSLNDINIELAQVNSYRAYLNDLRRNIIASSNHQQVEHQTTSDYETSAESNDQYELDQQTEQTEFDQQQQPRLSQEDQPSLAEIQQEEKSVQEFLVELNKTKALVQSGKKTREVKLPSLEQIEKDETSAKQYLAQLQQMKNAPAANVSTVEAGTADASNEQQQQQQQQQ